MADSAVHLTGSSTRDPELRFTNSGLASASFGLAINTRKKNDQGEWEDGEAQFYDITCFGSLAENVAESITKGTRVVVAGRLNFSQWEDSEGNRRSKVDVVADSIGPDLRWATCAITKNEKRQ